ncbi:hypothetical protein OD91_1115 [Lutibacter sp. Hel_I_33_5]|uniref:hypothetical protein n=1 Tax=Lutibacter sp. Hel_I_33_5 TaxID=1566289 RepID=UPI0011A58D3D|nr:hypothetical protein [Lutibacter sp. Hel_I_33_5]TVZ55846.1 hypothetical protein OD91_1115 [Lutibacter sp. Hel_I_33_5]
MFSKNNLISTVVATLWAFFGGYLLWDIIGGSLLESHKVTAGLMRSTPDYFHLILGCFIVALVFSIVYSKWTRGQHSISQGAEFGLWISILFGLGNGLIDYSTANILDITGTLINAVLFVVYYVIMGIIVSLVYNKLSGAKE